MPSYIDKRRRRYYAVLDIPEAVRPKFKRKRFVKSLQTDSLSEAEIRVMSVVHEWKKLIKAARTGTVTSFDDIINHIKVDKERLKADGLEDWEIAMYHEDLATTPDFDQNGKAKYNNDFYEAVEVVHKGRLLLSEHIEPYLSSTELEPKTIDGRRKSLKQFSARFKFIEDVTRADVRYWLNVEIGERQNKSRATLGRLVTDCNQYWEYLQVHHGLDIPTPFSKVLPPKNKKKSKIAVAAQRKAFRVEDYHRLIKASLDKGDDTLADLIKLAAHTGCRIEELCSLKLGNVHDDRIIITDAKTEAGWREIPIHKDIKQTVTRLMNTATTDYLLSGLSFNKYGDRSNAIGKRFGRLKTELGYGPDYVFHSLRRAFSTQLENAGVERTTVARLMGHELGDQTFGGYSDGLYFDRLKEAVGKIDYRR